ncbi:glycoside hydrolase superfamily [Aspergillus pseudotamarii]|uniref:Glycoside hydrolase superfamily n=1 Tax=Aspergillus pseudotamarii TaxID=132259 RepID=A0A5N6SW81_ASPPS|nr:glycoside hydrolase superfamily [Aspergillus pseudotamarii]KAE8138882.1 glycoside hydrolase superfamily [Aspergillus pseudotamarii]
MDIYILTTSPPTTEASRWQDKQTLQQRALKVMAMLGGACLGSFILDEIEQDIEEPMSQNGINRLVDRLRADFGPDFLITLAPVATALQGKAHLCGFNYLRFEGEHGNKIDVYNTQFYNGWGSLATTKDYDAISNTTPDIDMHHFTRPLVY